MKISKKSLHGGNSSASASGSKSGCCCGGKKQGAPAEYEVEETEIEVSK
jgi:hypothetical protein